MSGGRGSAGGGTRADALGAIAIVLGVAALAFGPRLVGRLSAHPTAAECEALLVRYAELKERSISEKVDPRRQAASLESARKLAGPRFSSCTAEVTLEEAECARRATNADEVERCLQ